MLKLLTVLVLSGLCSEVVLSEIDAPELSAKEYYNLENADELFKAFTAKYNKQYDADELKYRRKVFEQNLIKINRWNREDTNALFSITPFTDMTFEEFEDFSTGFLANATTDGDVPFYIPKGNAPEALDWRQKNYVTDVRMQGRCGSCYVFSAIANIEGQYAKTHGKLIELSDQQGLDCNPRGCEGGFMEHVYQALQGQGCMKRSDYPYEGVKRQCRTDSSKTVVKVQGGGRFLVQDEEALKDALFNIGPLSIAMQVNQEFMAYKGGIFSPQTCNTSGHAVLLVGYGSAGGVPYWIIKNSWSKQWGEQGYLRMVKGRKACNIGYYVASAKVV